jgi:hypothetical protein
VLMEPEKFPEILVLIQNVANVTFREYLGVLPPIFSVYVNSRYLKVSRYVHKDAHCRHMGKKSLEQGPGHMPQMHCSL